MLRILEIKSLMTELVSDIHNYQNDKKEGYEFEFDYYDVKQFKKLNRLIEERNEGREEEQQEHLNIIGNITLKKSVDLEDYKKYEDDEEEDRTLVKMDILDVDADYEQFDTYFEVTAPVETSTYGYIRVGNYDYIRIEEGMAAVVVTSGKFSRWIGRIVKFIIISLILSLLLFGLGRRFLQTYDLHKIIEKYTEENEDNIVGKIAENLIPETGLEVRQEEQVEMEYIEIAGYMDLLVYEGHQEINLINLEGNTVYQTYTIYEGDKKIYETDLIPPGKAVKWNAYESLDAGMHEVIFDIATYDYVVDEEGNVSVGGACNGAKDTVSIECRK